MKRFVIVVWFLAAVCAGYAQAPNDGSWSKPPTFSVVTAGRSRTSTSGTPISSRLGALDVPPAIAEAITPEIQALATGLETNAVRIYNYVRNNIRHEFYFGAKKGARLTLLEKSGNDFDQCSLLVALLRASGYSPKYQFGVMPMPYEAAGTNNLKQWLNLNFSNTVYTNTVSYLGKYLNDRGYPILYTDTNNPGWFALHRVWVRLQDGTNSYYLDPAFKNYERVSPLPGFNLATQMGLDTNALSAVAEGSVTNSSVQGLKEENLRNKLRDYATNLLGSLRSSYPNASVQDLLGQEVIVQAPVASLPTRLTYDAFINSPAITEWQYIPTNYMSMLTVGIGSSNKVLAFPELGGERLSLNFNSTGTGVLSLGDNSIMQVNTSGGATLDVVLSVNHPFGTWDTNLETLINGTLADDSRTNIYQRTNSVYAIIYAFDVSDDQLRSRYARLDEYRARNATNEMTAETLNIMGLSWMRQSWQTERLCGRQLDMNLMYHHRLGRMGQEAGNGYYVDVYMQTSAFFRNTGYSASDEAAMQRHFDTSMYFQSALEHGVIEQTQASNMVAASTIKMLQIGNTNNQKTVLATSANWSSVSGYFSGYSSTGVAVVNEYLGRGYTLLLPQSGSQYLNGTAGWKGFGIVARRGFNMSMLISEREAYNGGFIDNPSAVSDSNWLQDLHFQQEDTFNPSPISTAQAHAGDPVNMADGSFRLEASDLTIGGPEPRGLKVARSYNSSRRNADQASMAYGWIHNYFFRLSRVSAPDAGLGETTPQQMAPMLVATCAALNFYNTQPEVKNWTVTALITKWGVDQLINKGISVTLGQDVLQFVEQPDGSFTPPASSTFNLVKGGGNFEVQERNGKSFKFTSSPGNLLRITDPYGQFVEATYDSSNRVRTVTDWTNRVLTFNYSGSPQRLTSVTNAGNGYGVTYVYGTNYSPQGDLIQMIDAEQKTTTFVYDTNHQMLATIDALSQVVTTNVYDSFGRVTNQFSQGKPEQKWQLLWTGVENMEIDPVGGKKSYIYDEKTRLVATIDALGSANRMVYDGQDHVVQTVSPLNETNQFIFDGRHNLVATIDPLSKMNLFFYDPQDRLVRSENARGYTNQFGTNYFGYNAQNSLTATTNGMGDWVHFEYNSNGTLSNRTDAAGKTIYGYDTNGLVNSITYPTTPSTGELFFNNSFGDVLIHTNSRGFITSFGYDRRRQLTNTIAPTNLTTRVVYDAVGNLKTSFDATNNATTHYWNATRKETGVAFPSTPQGVPATTNLYDLRDWLAITKDPLQHPTTKIFDLAGRVVSVIDPLLRSNVFGFDGNGRQISQKNMLGETSSNVWNARGELVAWIDPTNKSVLRQYDNAGNQTALTNRNTRKWQFFYDAAGRLTNTTTPKGFVTGRSFNDRGLLQSVREPSTDTINYSYDAKGRMTNQAIAGVGVNTGFLYDANDNRTAVIEGSKSNVWTFDAYDRVQNYTDSDGNLIQYLYDANHNLRTLIYPGNRPVNYFYDSLNRLTNVTDWQGRPTWFEYDLAGQLRKVVRPNGTAREITPDDAGQVQTIIERTGGAVGGSTAKPIAYFSLRWNPAGRIQYQYSAPAVTGSAIPSRSMTIDEDNRIDTFMGQTVVHDPDGNMTTGPLMDSTLVGYGYDTRNRLLGVGGLTYRYDPAGNRGASTNAVGTTKYIVNPNAPLSQVLVRTKPDNSKTYYIYGVGLLYEINENSSGTELNTRHYHFDLRGSTIALTDGTGSVTDRVDYSAYGSITYRGGVTDTPFLFNGRYGVQTDANGLLYMRARYYNPYLCRFINADPSGFAGGLNFFAYADGNPVSLIDPFGLGAVGESVFSSWVSNIRQNWFSDIQGFQSGAASAVAGLAQEGMYAVANPFGYAANQVRGLYSTVSSLLSDPSGFASNAKQQTINTLTSSRGIGATTIGVMAAIATGAMAEAGAAKTALPELRISAGKFPDLAENILNAQKAGHPDVLTHGGEAVINANRNAALHQPYRDFVPNIGKGLSRDEYPFASSVQGGGGSWVGHIPVSQQQAQGGLIRAMNLKPGDQYRVVIVP